MDDLGREAAKQRAAKGATFLAWTFAVAQLGAGCSDGGVQSTALSSSSGASPTGAATGIPAGMAGSAAATGSSVDTGGAGAAGTSSSPGTGGTASTSGGNAGSPGDGGSAGAVISSTGGTSPGSSGSATGGSSEGGVGGVGVGGGGLDAGGAPSGGMGAGGAVVFDENLPDDDGVGHWHHAHINSVDPPASVEFYTTWFASEAATYGERDALWTQESWVLFNPVDTAPAWPIVSSVYHIGWTVTNMDSTYDAMVAAGVSFETPITSIATVFGSGNAEFAYAEGPDRELIEFYQASANEFMHLHFIADDPIASGQWYKDHFGATGGNGSPAVNFVNDRQIGPNMNVRIDAVQIWWYPTGFAEATYDYWEGQDGLDPQRGRAIDHFALSVDNLPQALERLEGEGVEILEQPAWRENGAFISAFVQGPDLVEIEVVQGHAEQP